ncbi:MAG: glycoside hydrolase family 16 protein [Rariglobus sp.]
MLKTLLITLLALGLFSNRSLGEGGSFASPTVETVARPVVDLAAADAARLSTPSHDQVAVTRASSGPGIEVAVAPGPAGFPGVNFLPANGAYDLSGSGYVEARITNTGTNIISVTLRLDNAGGQGTSTGAAYLKPGQSGTARAYYASPVKGSNPVDAANISRIIFFLGKNEKAPRSFRIESIVAGGTPGEQAAANPDLVRLKPARGLLFGGGASFDSSKQLVARAGATAAPASPAAGQPVDIAFTGKPDQNVLFRPARGFWDLSDHLQVRVRVKNTGTAPAALSAQLISRGGPSDFGTLEKPVAPGATADLVVSFIPKTPFEIVSDPEQERLEHKKNWGVKEAPGSRFFSHQTTGLLLQPLDATSTAKFQIVAITAELPAAEPAPAWLGQRPPVSGDWVKTFEDNFDGDTLNTGVWNIYASNFWDKRVGFSKHNVLLGDGFARLRIEKRAGHHNDDPAERATEFATGWLDTYGKWTQRYGYYEVRVKLPTAPSMFPAFWLMPERGPAEWPKHRRTETKDGGMEFDVFEGQSMWGPYRTTFGAHWDHYGIYHKVAGTTAHYNRPDKDGFLTIGFLWTPGHVSVYSQGRKGGSWDSPRVGSVQSYVIFDLLPGGFEYDPLDPASLPADLVIDYIRVWQRKDLATAQDGTKSLP